MPLVEVLPRSIYDDEHLPGAINVPLKRIDRDAGKQLDAHRPVIVYWRLIGVLVTHDVQQALGQQGGNGA